MVNVLRVIQFDTGNNMCDHESTSPVIGQVAEAIPTSHTSTTFSATEPRYSLADVNFAGSTLIYNLLSEDISLMWGGSNTPKLFICNNLGDRKAMVIRDIRVGAFNTTKTTPFACNRKQSDSFYRFSLASIRFLELFNKQGLIPTPFQSQVCWNTYIRLSTIDPDLVSLITIALQSPKVLYSNNLSISPGPSLRLISPEI